jgi:hypothetical protein
MMHVFFAAMEQKLHQKADGRKIDILVDEEESVSSFGRSWLLFGLMVLPVGL